MTSHGRDLKFQYSIVISDHYQRLPAQSRMPTAQRSALKHYGFPCFGYEGQKLLEALNVVQ